jgi:hypothetical protein
VCISAWKTTEPARGRPALRNRWVGGEPPSRLPAPPSGRGGYADKARTEEQQRARFRNRRRKGLAQLSREIRCAVVVGVVTGLERIALVTDHKSTASGGRRGATEVMTGASDPPKLGRRVREAATYQYFRPQPHETLVHFLTTGLDRKRGRHESRLTLSFRRVVILPKALDLGERREALQKTVVRRVGSSRVARGAPSPLKTRRRSFTDVTTGRDRRARRSEAAHDVADPAPALEPAVK